MFFSFFLGDLEHAGHIFRRCAFAWREHSLNTYIELYCKWGEDAAGRGNDLETHRLFIHDTGLIVAIIIITVRLGAASDNTVGPFNGDILVLDVTVSHVVDGVVEAKLPPHRIGILVPSDRLEV